jgi:hypothetical protein
MLYLAILSSRILFVIYYCEHNRVYFFGYRKSCAESLVQ